MSFETLIATSVALASFVLSLLATRWLVSVAPGSGLAPLDRPNARSLHTTAVPRSGGLAVLLGVVVPLGLLALLGRAEPTLGWIALALAPVVGIGYLDDLGDVSRRLRLVVQALAGVLLIGAGLRWVALDLPGWVQILPFWVSAVLSLLYVIWMINLYNFMDGMDGFAGGMALFGFSSLAVLGWVGGEPLFALTSAAIALSAAGFLVFNVPPARIFLGDAGSSGLGLLVAACSLWGVSLGLFPLWAAWLAFSPFIVDATWTLLARLARGERVWEPHRSHHYQRLVLSGWTHRQTLVRAYVVMAACAACAVAAPRLPTHEQWMLLGAWVTIYGLIHVKVRLVERGGAAARP
jgi:UDP-N-acetylmuramyl pentapeptide phosphotransferase/UDP-N-acetylglucosamine-1-phosphate transferase